MLGDTAREECPVGAHLGRCGRQKVVSVFWTSPPVLPVTEWARYPVGVVWLCGGRAPRDRSLADRNCELKISITPRRDQVGAYVRNGVRYWTAAASGSRGPSIVGGASACQARYSATTLRARGAAGCSTPTTRITVLMGAPEYWSAHPQRITVEHEPGRVVDLGPVQE